MTQLIDFDWCKFQASLITSLGVNAHRRKISSRSMGDIEVPLTTSFVYARPFEYYNSPCPYSLNRKLQNAFLFRLSKTGIFSAGHWLDVGGTRAYGDWLKVPPSRYDIFNLPEAEGVTVVGDFDDTENIDFSRQYDGVISLNCLFMSRKPEIAIDNIMRLLKPKGLAVLDFSVHHYWYISEDGDHFSTFNPFQVTYLIHSYMDNFLIVPIGNLFEAWAEYYARRVKIGGAYIKSLIRTIGLHIGKMDREPRTAMDCIVVGQKR